MRIHPRFARLLVAATLTGVLGASVPLAPALQADAVAGERRGGCSAGDGEWRLRVRAADSDRLRIMFRVKDVRRGSTWQIFISDNHRRVLATSRKARPDGDLRVLTRTRNRKGTDRIAATAVNTHTGVICRGRVRR